MLHSQTPPARWLDLNSSPQEVEETLQFLKQAGTFDFPSLPNGLFSAAAGQAHDFELTGYQNVWVRDNVHVAWSLWEGNRDRPRAVRCLRALLDFFQSQQPRLRGVIEGSTDPAEVQNRPHIRFDGRRLCELPEKWPHAQNDALGYLLWLGALMAADGELALQPADWESFSLLIHYFLAIEVWRDEDSGHWEENRKLAASSVGSVCAGLSALLDLVTDNSAAAAALAETSRPLSIEQLADLLQKCRQALHEILPLECRQSDPLQHRQHDAALLFLIYPLNQVRDSQTVQQILDSVAEQLTGPIGIRRYNGDSYWCNDYRQQFTAELRSSDFSEDISNRDRLLRPGLEAQWCLFDPIVACIYGRRYEQTGESVDLARQVQAVQRSLGQLTRPEDRFPPYRCPESWFWEQGNWIPNDITPLLWTQANLIQALDSLQRSFKLRDENKR